MADWPSRIRGPLREEEARQVAVAIDEEAGQAYRLAALIAEDELANGRGGEELHQAAEAFCDALERAAGLTD
jgi:hypothetical protein